MLQLKAEEAWREEDTCSSHRASSICPPRKSQSHTPSFPWRMTAMFFHHECSAVSWSRCGAGQMWIVEMPMEAAWLTLDLRWGGFNNLAARLVGVAWRLLSHQLQKGQRNSTGPILFLPLSSHWILMTFTNQSDSCHLAEEAIEAQRGKMTHPRPHS